MAKKKKWKECKREKCEADSHANDGASKIFFLSESYIYRLSINFNDSRSIEDLDWTFDRRKLWEFDFIRIREIWRVYLLNDGSRSVYFIFSIFVSEKLKRNWSIFERIKINEWNICSKSGW